MAENFASLVAEADEVAGPASGGGGRLCGSGAGGWWRCAGRLMRWSLPWAAVVGQCRWVAVVELRRWASVAAAQVVGGVRPDGGSRRRGRRKASV